MRRGNPGRLLLLHGGPDFLGVLAIIRQPQPDLRHVG